MDELLTNDNVGEADKGTAGLTPAFQAMRRRRRCNEKERGAEADKKKPWLFSHYPVLCRVVRLQFRLQIVPPRQMAPYLHEAQRIDFSRAPFC